jgi:hypothetical protein
MQRRLRFSDSKRKFLRKWSQNELLDAGKAKRVLIETGFV